MPSPLQSDHVLTSIWPPWPPKLVMLSRSLKIQQPRVVWDDLTFHCHQITIFTCTRSNQGHFLDNWRSNWRSNTISLKMEQWRQVGCRFRVFQAAWLISGIKNHVLFTGGHLGMKSGGQSDLHFDILDIMRNIVKWGIIFRVFQVAWLISGIKNDLLFTGGHLGMKSGGQSDLHFDISDIMRNIVKWGIFSKVF